MTVSNKMIEMVRRLGPTPRSYYENNQCHIISSEEEAQAVVNAAWHEFDLDDLSTHPDMAGDYLVMWKNVGRIDRLYLKLDGHWGTTCEDLITHWADPSDLLYVREDQL